MTHTEPDQTEFQRDYPGADPLRVRYEVLLETWTELERVRGAGEPEATLGTEQEIDAANIMLAADVFQQVKVFEPEIIAICVERGILSATEADKLKALRQRLDREQELLAARIGRADRQYDRER